MSLKMQTGATLAIALIMLLIISLLAVGAMQVGQMQEKMSSNLHDKEVSFRASESALRAGEAWILALTKEPIVVGNCQTFPCVRDMYQNTNFTTQTSSWWQSNSAAYSNQLSSVATVPRYIIEYLQFVPDSPVVGSTTQGTGVHYFRITSRGTGGSNDAVTILQTTIARRF